MAELKTIENDGDVQAFIASVDNERRRIDTETVCALMQELSGHPPRMWGDSMIGFGRYRYEYKTGTKGEWMRIGVSPRKTSLTLYLMTGFEPHASLMETLGKHKTGAGCLYINKLADVDMDVLRELISSSLRYSEQQYPTEG